MMVDPAYPAGGPDYLVRAVSLQPDGRLLIAGLFTNVNGLARPRFARLNPDGTIDESFSPRLNLDPRGIYPLPDGRIFVSGAFTNVNGTPRFNLANLNADGSLDTGFEPPLPSRPIDTLTGLPSPDGSVWVSGTFTNLGGLPRNRFARLLANGSVDAACPSPFTPGNSLTVAAVQPDGRVFVAGNFHAVAGVPMEGVVRLNTDGSVDTTFRSGLAPTNHMVRAVLQTDGRLVAAVTAQAPESIFVGPQRLVRLNVDGSIDAEYHVDFDFVGFPYSGGIYALHLQADGRVLVTGNFLRVNGTPRASLARIPPD